MKFVCRMSHCNTWGHAWMESCWRIANTGTTKLDNAPSFHHFCTCHDQCEGVGSFFFIFILNLPNPQNQKSTSKKKSRVLNCICYSAPPLPVPSTKKILMSSAKLANNHGQDFNDFCQVPTSTPQQQELTPPFLKISKHQHCWHSEHLSWNPKSFIKD